MGWDDNGLPTERRVQNYYGVRCDPSLPYDPAFAPPDKPRQARRSPVSRPNFIELCERLTAEDEKAFEHLWRYLGLSVDWSMTYATIGQRAQRVSQLAFLRLLARGLAYQLEAPTLWDVDFRTAVAQAELEDREMPGAYHRIRVRAAPTASGVVEIDTTRPELIPACVALVAHPDDERYQPLFGTEVITPLFGVRVPVRAAPLADPEKGTGIAMICTFGDITDVTWWRELALPVRAVIQPNGTLRAGRVGQRRAGSRSTPARAQRPTTSWPACRPRRRARRSSSCCRRAATCIGEPRPITHPVKFYEKGDRPLEIVTSRQWFIKTIDFREALLARGRELQWHPPYMQARYENWVNGLNGDWCVSRQRFFGVPFPVWYPLDADGAVDYDAADCCRPRRSCRSTRRPTCRPATRADQRGQPGGFVGDPDVMDTWATSSLTPQIAGGWEDDPDLFARVFPMDLRPQAHDIIRTWLFYTVLRAHLEHDSLPWTQRGDLRLGARSRPQEDVEVEGQRRHADGAARGARLRRRALLGGQRPAGHRHRVRHRPDEGRPAAGDQDAERVEVRARRSRAARRRSRAPVDRAMLTSLARAGRRGDRRVSRRTTTRACSSGPRRSSGASATTTSSW